VRPVELTVTELMLFPSLHLPPLTNSHNPKMPPGSILPSMEQIFTFLGITPLSISLEAPFWPIQAPTDTCAMQFNLRFSLMLPTTLRSAMTLKTPSSIPLATTNSMGTSSMIILPNSQRRQSFLGDSTRSASTATLNRPTSTWTLHPNGS